MILAARGELHSIGYLNRYSLSGNVTCALKDDFKLRILCSRLLGHGRAHDGCGGMRMFVREAKACRSFSGPAHGLCAVVELLREQNSLI
jgi:hypothetical protein